MPRTLSANVAGLIASGLTRVCHLLEFTVGLNNYRFAEDAVNHGGNAYTPHLKLESPVKFTNKLQLEPVTVRLQNVDLNTAGILLAEQPNMSGVAATLKRLYLPARETITLFVGSIGEIALDEEDAVLTLVGELDPTASQAPTRKYSHLHSDGRTLLDLVAAGQSHLFDGFLSITRELTELIEGHQPDAGGEERSLGDFDAWE